MNFPLWINSFALRKLSVEEVIEFTSSLGLQGIEFTAFSPLTKDSRTHLKAEHLQSEYAEWLMKILNKYKLHVSFCCYENLLGHDAEKQLTLINHLLKLIRFASYMGGEENKIRVHTFAGYRHFNPPHDSFQKNLENYERIFGKLIEYAEKNNVKLLYENCPMEGWTSKEQSNTYNNLSAALGARKLMYTLIPSVFHGEIYDPSHDIWQFNDPVKIVENSDIQRINGIHIKSTRLIEDEHSIHWGRVYPIPSFDNNLSDRAAVPVAKNEWKRYPYENVNPDDSLNDPIDWRKFINVLEIKGFSGPLIIENQTDARQTVDGIRTVTEGIIGTKDFISPFAWKRNKFDYCDYKPLKKTARKQLKELTFDKI